MFAYPMPRVLLFILPLLAFLALPVSAANHSLPICHVPSGNPANAKTKWVKAKAVAAHLAHGDYRGPCAEAGDRASLGSGQVETYVQRNEDETPYALGVAFSAAMLQNLPQQPADGNHCWDVDGDGDLHSMHECIGGHQRILFLPSLPAEVPFKWVLLNWNPHGHAPHGIYSVPHFDFHFYTQDYLARNFIRPGPCALLVNCDDFARGTVPVPAQFLPPDYADLGAVEARMGNHLIDLTSPEFQPMGNFTHTFIFGAYDGHLTFWEPMITHSFLQSGPDLCTPIKQPAAFEVAGFYPQDYCIRYYPARDEYRVSLENFVYHSTF